MRESRKKKWAVCFLANRSFYNNLACEAGKQNKRMNEHNGISVTEIVQIYKHTFLKSFSRFGRNSVYYVWNYHNYTGKDRQDRYAKEGY